MQRLSKHTVPVIFLSLVLLFVGVNVLGKERLRESPITICASGFSGSFIFFFLALFISEVNHRFDVVKIPSPITISLSLIFSLYITSIVDLTCSVFCVAFCMPLMIYFSHLQKIVFPEIHAQ